MSKSMWVCVCVCVCVCVEGRGVCVSPHMEVLVSMFFQGCYNRTSRPTCVSVCLCLCVFVCVLLWVCVASGEFRMEEMFCNVLYLQFMRMLS